jgi:hypothetical protein
VIPRFTDRMLRRVDRRNPVNRRHPLAQSLRHLWLPLPGLIGVRRVYDLASAAGQTLAARFDAASGGSGYPTWQRWYGPGGPVSVGFEGTESLLETDINPSTWGSTFTIFAAVRPTAASDYRGIAGDHSGTAGIIFGQHWSAAGGWVFGVGDGTAPNSFPTKVAVSSLTLNEPVHLVMSVGANLVVYVNGVEAASIAVPAVSHAFTFPIGRAYNDTNRYFQGQIQHVGVYTRALSALDAASLYREWRTGWPGLLRRHPETMWDEPVGPSFQPAWAVGATQTAGVIVA